MIYNYSIQYIFPYKKVNMGSLIEELKTANIPVESLVIQGDIVKIITLLTLTTEQENTIDTIISLHKGEPLTQNYTEKIKIVEEQVNNMTQGHFQSMTIDLFISGVTGTTYKDHSFPFPVSLFSSEWLVNESQIGDVAEFHVSPDTICGVLTQAYYSGETTLHVSDTVFEQANIMLGYYVNINEQDLGRVIAKDKENLTITVENPLQEDINIGSYILLTIKIVPYWRFNASGFCSVGESKIGASFIPANTVLRMVYHNNSGKEKWFAISIDYLY